MNSALSTTNDFISIENGTIHLSRKTAFWAGFFYILTFVSIPTLFLYQPIHEPDYLLSNANDNKIVMGAILEIIVALCCIISSIIMYSVLKKQNEILAFGLVAARILEACTIFVGVAFILGAVTLHQQGVGENAIATSRALVALYDRIFVLGQSFMPAIDDLLLGILLYKSRLVPRWLSVIGIIGAFPLFAGYFSLMFGVIDRSSPLTGASAIMVAFFEFTLGIYLLSKGIRKSSPHETNNQSL
ncbi:DUF4386 domain-containing protein [Agriterribacter sp.]|uniref:DUF4386 domain-containing protein n=1 Tax=Agriterribacter sp. TaxID=2821509 RepID=UPI002C29A532|nr:DUF4386 domain-containing protein [Agriterribacter sp.]HRO44477.1 DUF4386 domain-containing protein [Agriterribacter sp.]HRQ16497.1 DUF4386 domain-containing protein [Agriterribacter sp.]